MIKELINTLVLKYRLKLLLRWHYKLCAFSVDYSKFKELNNQYCLFIKNNKSYNKYYIELAYRSDLSVDEILDLIYSFIIENCTCDDANFDKENAREICLSNYYEEVK